MTRKIWLRKNSIVHEGKFKHPSQVLREAKESFVEFKRNNAMNIEGLVPQIAPELVAWQAPSPRIIKVNWDAAVEEESRQVGVGIIA